MRSRLTRRDVDTSHFDIFTRPLAEDVRDLDSRLSVAIRTARQSNMPLPSIYEIVKDDVSRIISASKSLADGASLGGVEEYAYYDMAHEICSKWISFANLSGHFVSPPQFAPDNRFGADEALRDSTAPVIRGVVIKAAMQKTVTVLTERRYKDKRTGKYIKRSKKYLVHDEYGSCQIGDHIIAREGRPLSKMKRHSFVAKLRK